MYELIVLLIVRTMATLALSAVDLDLQQQCTVCLVLGRLGAGGDAKGTTAAVLRTHVLLLQHKYIT